MSKLGKRLAAKESWENRKARKANNREVMTIRATQVDQRVQREIARDNQKKSKLDKIASDKDVNLSFLQEVERKAPKLLDNEYKEAVLILSRSSHKRSVKDWVPRGKGKMTQFISLADHVWALYPVPKFLWSAFWEQDIKSLYPIVKRIAAGESFAKMCQDGTFPLPLTKKQCHAFLNSSAEYSFINALRKVQVETHGGSERILRAWMARDVGKTLNTTWRDRNEVFWDSVLAWFCKNPMLDLTQLGPLLDYISHKKNEDKEFSIKGRSALAMLRGMQEWHGDLAKKRNFEEHNYKPSGFKSGIWETTRKERTGHMHEIWSVDEILTSKDLHKEGSTLGHCVASYGHSISSGVTSIWSLSCNGQKRITIEVRNVSRRIVQARGKFNRVYDNEEYKYILKWAQDNGIVIDVGRW